MSMPCPPSGAPPRDLEAFCRRVLEAGDLDAKLAAPVDAAGAPLPDTPSGSSACPTRPARAAGLRMGPGGDALPAPGELADPAARRTCLARFAHHELQAVEYFAWALLRWPELPAGLRRGWVAALQDEQRHCRLYLDRLRALGGRFETDDHSDYFWRQAEAIAASAAGPRAFLSAIGLTLEQANLDFTLTYRDAFAAAGDAESAAICQQVHDDEIAHVALAARWLARLEATEDTRPASSDPLLDAYLASVPFPLGPARAKGRRFAEAPRRRAGLSKRFIAHVRDARVQERDARPLLLLDNLGAEEHPRDATSEQTPARPAPARTAAALWSLLFSRHARRLGTLATEDQAAAAAWPRALGAPASEPVFAFLADPDALYAWLNTDAAQRRAEGRGLRLAGPEPAVVRRLHDKDFALRASEALGLTPRGLAPLLACLEPEELGEADALFDRLDARLRSWPDWTGLRFTLKPRFGSSGRGRLAGQGAIDRDRARGALVRLAARGGAIFEPWLERRGDFSVALHVAPEGADDAAPGITLLGSLECWNSASGVHRGHFGEIDSRGRVFSGAREDETLRADAAAVAGLARAAGFHGPCGVDGFRYLQPTGPAEGSDAATGGADEGVERLRPVVEFNARPTMGLVAIGLARRALPRVRKRLAIEPGARHGFALTQRAADDRDWRARIYARVGNDAQIVDLGAASQPGDPRASLVFARDPDALRAARASAFDC
jgi:uncharacterized ferritin-like protein (DUF455 family)